MLSPLDAAHGRRSESRLSDFGNSARLQSRTAVQQCRSVGQIVSQITRLSSVRVLSWMSLIHTSYHSLFSDQDLS